MPANLSVEAQKAQKEYEEAKSPSEKLKKGEYFLRVIPKHKGTESLQAQLKQSLAKLRKEIDEQKSKARHRKNLYIKRHGAGQICVMGFPNTGKSYLLNTLCNTRLDATDVPFETREPAAGMAIMEDIQLQMVEIPSFTENFASRENGPEMLNIMRNCDLILILVHRDDADREYGMIKDELEANGIVIDRRRKDIVIAKKISGGISILGKELFRGDLSAVKNVLIKSGMHNAEVIFREAADAKDLVECLEGSRVYKPSMVVYNISAPKGLLNDIWKRLHMVRIYTKRPGHKEKDEPLVAPDGSTVKNIGERIHKDFIAKFRFARVSGSSAKFDGQMVGLNHKLSDCDIVEFHLE